MGAVEREWWWETFWHSRPQHSAYIPPLVGLVGRVVGQLAPRILLVLAARLPVRLVIYHFRVGSTWSEPLRQGGGWWAIFPLLWDGPVDVVFYLYEVLYVLLLLSCSISREERICSFYCQVL